ncbi:hypothetical protein VNN36_00665 [Lactococcus garvieae]|uniref:hypothetical protein n=1 Tax=Lactococcus garvieae TaxID=1363 RepID=UPI0030CF5F54
MNEELITLVEVEVAENLSDLKRILREFKTGWPEEWRVCEIEIIPVWEAYCVKYKVEKIPEDE